MQHNESFILRLGVAYLLFSVLFRFMAGGGLSQFYVVPGSGPTVVRAFLYCSWAFTFINAGLFVAILARFCVLRKHHKPMRPTLLMLALLLVCATLNEWAKLTLVALFA